jgi:ABC-type transporter Mla subunit MlaD
VRVMANDDTTPKSLDELAAATAFLNAHAGEKAVTQAQETTEVVAEAAQADSTPVVEGEKAVTSEIGDTDEELEKALADYSAEFEKGMPDKLKAFRDKKQEAEKSLPQQPDFEALLEKALTSFAERVAPLVERVGDVEKSLSTLTDYTKATIPHIERVAQKVERVEGEVERAVAEVVAIGEQPQPRKTLTMGHEGEKSVQREINLEPLLQHIRDPRRGIADPAKRANLINQVEKGILAGLDTYNIPDEVRQKMGVNGHE